MRNNIDKNPPSSIDAENAVLASILIDSDVAEILIENAMEDDFYFPHNKAIFTALKELHKRGQALDIVTLFDKIASENLESKVGGIEYVSTLLQTIPNAANAEKYLKILKEKAILRNLISAGTEISNLGYDLSEDVNNLIDKAQDITSSLGDGASKKRSAEYIEDVILRYQTNLEKVIEENTGNSDITGVPSGFAPLDKITNGFQKSDLIIVAGRPAMGKTSFGLSILLNAAKQGKYCAFFSLEMSSEQLVRRLISTEAKISQHTLRTANFNSDELGRHNEALNNLAKLPVYLDDTTSITTNQIKAKCRKLYNEGKLDIIFIDYLQIMGYSSHLQIREQQISEISRSLKNMAKEFNIPVVALAQVNRNVEKAENKRPRLSDLRESGAIEQDADIIMFLYRDKVYNENTIIPNIAEIIIEKHRNGENGTAYVHFNQQFTHFDGSVHVNQAEIKKLVEENRKTKITTKGSSKTKRELEPGEIV